MTQELNEFRVSVVAESGFPSFHDARPNFKVKSPSSRNSAIRRDGWGCSRLELRVASIA